MSIATWHSYGYGICTDKIKTTVEQLKAFIDSEPDYKERVLGWLKTDYWDSKPDKPEPTAEEISKVYADISLDGILETIEDHDDYAETGLACAVRSVLSMKTGIPLMSARDSNSELSYVIMPSYYPWEVNRNTALQRINSEDDIRAVFAQHIAVLTNQTLDELDWGEQDIEGWG